MKINLTQEELNKIIIALEMQMGDESIPDDPSDTVYELISKLQQYQEIANEAVNENLQILDKVVHDKSRGYITGEIDGKYIVMVQGSTYLVDPSELKEYTKKPDLTTVPHMKFDEKTQALLFEQFVRCGVYSGNVPIRLQDCYVRYNQWEKASPDQQIKVLVEGNTIFMPKSQVRVLENLNDFANPDNYVPGVLIDEATGQVIENILVQAIDYTNAIGDADGIRIIRETPAGDQEMQTVPKAAVRTLAV
jgi:uncharacterized protein (UPF0147 family)